MVKEIKKRNYNLDILRILSMIMIITLHYCTFGCSIKEYGGIGYPSQPLWIIYAFCHVAVNVYVLISGYFLCESNFKWRKVLRLAIEVWFYSLIIGLVFFLVGKEDFNSFKTALRVFCPLLSRTYWFISIYLIMYIISPFMNKLINVLNKKEYQKFLITVGIIYLICNNFFIGTDLMDSTGGSGILWFIYLYFVSGYIRKYDLPKIKNIYYFCFYCILSIMTYLSRVFILKYLSVLDIYKGQELILYSYNSITVFGGALFLFMFFKNMNLKERWPNFIYKVSLATFGVYLIHEHFFMRSYLFYDLLNISDYVNRGLLVKGGIMLLTVLGIFTICTFIDFIRQWIFKKLEI